MGLLRIPYMGGTPFFVFLRRQKYYLFQTACRGCREAVFFCNKGDILAKKRRKRMGKVQGNKELQGMPGGEGKKRLQESILSCNRETALFCINNIIKSARFQ